MDLGGTQFTPNKLLHQVAPVEEPLDHDQLRDRIGLGFLAAAASGPRYRLWITVGLHQVWGDPVLLIPLPGLG